jgi:hypothetical protein
MVHVDGPGMKYGCIRSREHLDKQIRPAGWLAVQVELDTGLLGLVSPEQVPLDQVHR